MERNEDLGSWLYDTTIEAGKWAYRDWLYDVLGYPGPDGGEHPQQVVDAGQTAPAGPVEAGLDLKTILIAAAIVAGAVIVARL